MRLISSSKGRLVVLFLMVFAVGCSKEPPAAPKINLSPEVKVVRPEKRTIVRTTAQPGFIEAYEQTAIFPKISGFVDEWKVDIGDRITKDTTVLAHLDVPDLIAEHEEKKAEVELDEVRIKVAEEMVNVATENWKTASAQVEEAKANLGKYAADVVRWKADYARISALAKNDSVEKPVEDESYKQLQSSIASQHAAESGIVVAEATRAARKADVAKAKIDVEAARARTKVDRAAERRLAAMVGYATIKAPYDGIVVKRNVNVGDFARPATGDQTAANTNSQMSAGSSHPLYVVARTDKVRIFLDVPEMEANGIHAGSNARISIQAVDNLEFTAQVTRTSWSLNANSRTLRAEVDVPNPGGRILPNMYAYGSVELTRVGVWAVPTQAVIQRGNQHCCYGFEEGKVIQIPVQLGIDDGTWAEVTAKRSKEKWLPLDGTEQLVVGDLSQLSNGESVRTNETAVPQK